MRMLFVVAALVVYIGLPLHAAMTDPLVANWSQFATEFLTVASVLAIYTAAFTVAAVVLDRCLSGKWLWEDTVVLHRRSHHTTYVPKSTSQLLHEYWSSEEGKAEYIAWLSHK